MTHFCGADWDRFANDVSRSGGFCAHRNPILLGFFTFFLYLCVDLLLLGNEIICVFVCLEGV